MKLNSLEITIDRKPRQSIHFHDGLNLITNKRDTGRSGNSVGKSTLSRIVDFLFLGSLDSIYIDEEFKKPNHDVEYLFTNHSVEAELSFTGIDNRLHKIKRNFSINNENCTFIFDGDDISESDYEKKIKQACFNITTKRPSIRSLIPKFIRNNSHSMLNTTKVLSQWSGGKDYSELFLYLFGFQNTELLTQKRTINSLVTKRKRNSKSINSMVSEQKPTAEIKKFTHEAKKLEENLLKFDYSPEYNDPVARLTELQRTEDLTTDELLKIDRKISNINNTIDLLSQEDGSYLGNELQAIYNYANISLSKPIRELESVISFHDNLVLQKKKFLSTDLPLLQEDKTRLEKDIASINENKLEVFSDMRSLESINNITENLKNLGSLKIQLGKLEGLLEQQKKAKIDLTLAEDDLIRILSEISNQAEQVHVFEQYFNKNFKKITKETHNEEYEFDLNFNDKTGICDIEVKSIDSNPEGGKKKAEVIAFDFAYIKTVDETNIKRPQFVFHDSIEDIDQKQIDVIFSQAKELPGQQIISMLSDKLTDEMYEKYLPDVVLLLDEDHMFFGV